MAQNVVVECGWGASGGHIQEIKESLRFLERVKACAFNFQVITAQQKIIIALQRCTFDAHNSSPLFATLHKSAQQARQKAYPYGNLLIMRKWVTDSAIKKRNRLKSAEMWKKIYKYILLEKSVCADGQKDRQLGISWLSRAHVVKILQAVHCLKPDNVHIFIHTYRQINMDTRLNGSVVDKFINSETTTRISSRMKQSSGNTRFNPKAAAYLV